MIEVVLIIIIVLLLAWIYYSGGGTTRTLRLSRENKDLREEVASLRKANEAIRSGIEYTHEELSAHTMEACKLVEDLERLKDALVGTMSAEETLKEKFDEGPSPELVRLILDSKPEIDSSLKRRLADEVLVGDLGREILRDLDMGKSIADASTNAGVPLQKGRRKIRALQITGYLDSKLNLTEYGRKALS